jgi:hypothetical protein
MSSNDEKIKLQGVSSAGAAVKRIWFSSKTGALLDGVGSLLDVFPDPRPRTIRAFVRNHRDVRARSVKQALLNDWAAIGQDMWAAIEAHEREESTEKATPTGLKALTAR